MKNHKVYQRVLILIGVLFMYQYGYGQTTKYIEATKKIVYRSPTDPHGVMAIDTDNGRLGIGTTHPQYTLEVVGKTLIAPDGHSNPIQIGDNHNFSLWVTQGVVAEDLFIVNKDNWADYVFEEDHDLPSLEEIQLYIDQHKHLPGVPSAAEVKAEGYTQHDLNTTFLEKIEELTLYTIEQQKLITSQSKIISEQKNEIENLMKKIVEPTENE